MPINSQFGAKAESTYGTGVTVDRFFEFESESISTDVGRAESPAIVSGQRVQAAERFVTWTKGATGSVTVAPATLGFGFWLEHMLGAVATAGPTDSAYTHTATVADLCGTSFTAQVNRAFGACGATNQAFTWTGCKVASWTLSMDAEGFLSFEAEIVAQGESTVVALATASYPSGSELFSFASAQLTVDATAVPVYSWSISCDNNLDADRSTIRNDAGRLEPTENGFRSIEAEFTCDFSDLTHYNKVVGAAAADTLVALEVTATGPAVIGAGSTYPSIVATIANLRLDEATAQVGGVERIEQSVKGMAVQASGAEPIEIVYTTADATP